MGAQGRLALVAVLLPGVRLRWLTLPPSIAGNKICDHTVPGVSVMRKHLLALALASVSTLALAAPFQNGSFETGTLNNTGSFDTLATGSTAITGWTVIGDGIDYMGAAWTAAAGSRSIDTLSCGVSGGVSQTFDTVVGGTYVVSLALAGNPDGGVKTLVASAASATANFTFNTAGRSGSNMGWTTVSFAFIATGSTTTLSLLGGVQGGGNSCAGAAIDNVSVTQISGPAAVPLGGGLGGAALIAVATWLGLRRRQRQG